MIRYWSVIRTELAREGAVARAIIDRGFEVVRLVELRYIRKTRHARSKRVVEANLLPGKVIALIPDIAMGELGTIPNAKFFRDAQGEPWRIPDHEVRVFSETVQELNSGEWSRLIDEAEADNQARQAKKRKKWQGLKEGLKSLLKQ